MLVTGLLASGCSTGGTAAPVASRARAATATVLVLGDQTVTQVNAVTRATGKPYHVQPLIHGSPGGGRQIVAFAQTPRGLTAYVIANGGVVPINLTTRSVGQVISLGTQGNVIAASPDGTTVYVTTGSTGADGTVIPIDTRVNGVGQPIPVGEDPQAITFSPDGKTAYVGDDGDNTVTPISLPDETAGQPIQLPGTPDEIGEIVFTPDGKTAYVATGGQVTPIDVLRGIAGSPIPAIGINLVITPDGKTLYAGSPGSVTPIDTATNTPGAPIAASGGGLLMSPDGKALYSLDGSGKLTVIDTATNAASSPGRIGESDQSSIRDIAITPDGKTVFMTGLRDVIPFDTASRTIGQPIRLTDFASNVAVTP